MFANSITDNKTERNGQNETKKKKKRKKKNLCYVSCHISCVMCHVLCVSCHLSLTPTATASNLPSPIIVQSGLVCKDRTNHGNGKHLKMSRGVPILTIRSLTRSLQTTGKQGNSDGTQMCAIAVTHTHTTNGHWDWTGPVSRFSENMMKHLQISLSLYRHVWCIIHEEFLTKMH